MNKLFALLSISLFSFSYGQYYKAELLYKDGNTEKGLLNSLVDINRKLYLNQMKMLRKKSFL